MPPIKSTGPLKNRFGHFRAGWRIALYIGLCLGINKGLTILGQAVLIRGENLGDYALLANRFTSKLIQFVSVLIPGLVLLEWVDRRPVAMLGIRGARGTLKKLFAGMATGFLLISASGAILWLGGFASFSFNGLSFDLLLYLCGCLAVLVISACYEEVLFRGYAFQSMIEGTNIWITLGIFALLFGAGHVSNAGATVSSVIVTVVGGVFLGTIYYRTRTLWMCIGAHFMWNWTLGPLLGIGKSESYFLRRSLFTYVPSGSPSRLGADAAHEIILGVLVAAFTIYFWKARWLKPSEYDKTLWAQYPARHGVGPKVQDR